MRKNTVRNIGGFFVNPTKAGLQKSRLVGGGGTLPRDVCHSVGMADIAKCCSFVAGVQHYAM